MEKQQKRRGKNSTAITAQQNAHTVKRDPFSHVQSQLKLKPKRFYVVVVVAVLLDALYGTELYTYVH